MLFACVSVLVLIGLGACTYGTLSMVMYFVYRKTGGKRSFKSWKKSMGF